MAVRGGSQQRSFASIELAEVPSAESGWALAHPDPGAARRDRGSAEFFGGPELGFSSPPTA